MPKYDRIPCYGENKNQIIYLRDWDRVEVEWQFGSYRLDLALLKKDQVVGAIEILVTHPSEQRKIAFLNERQITWLEIKVSPEFYTVPTAWTAELPLEATNYNQSLITVGQCDKCGSSAETHKSIVKQKKRNQQESKKKCEYAKQFETIAVRIIDFYYRSGKRYRSIFIIQNKVKDGKAVYSQLQELGSQRRTIATEPAPISSESYQRLKVALQREIKTKNNGNTIVDDSSGWLDKPERFHPKKFLNLDRYPFNYEQVVRLESNLT